MIRQILLTKQFNRDKLLGLLNRGALEDEARLTTVRRIIKQVREERDKGLFRLLSEVEGQKLNASNLAVDKRTIKNSIGKIDRILFRSLKESAKRIRRYHAKQVQKNWFISEAGIKSGMIVRPLANVGIYVPGGGASYPSTLLMNVVAAQVAGVKDIAVATPANIAGEVDTVVLAAASILGIDRIYKMGGAQAIAAFAYGTQTVPRVEKITGPGNIYVTLAKKEVSGVVGIDMLAGPSEVLIVADKDSNAEIVASDMLAQAEHGPDAMAILVTDSEQLAKEVQKRAGQQLKRLSKKNAQRGLNEASLILISKNWAQIIEVVNEIAAEHLLLYTKRAKTLVPQIRNAGAIFVGKYSAIALGDYAAGPNHTLPTMGTAAFSSPLSVEDFVKKSSYLEVRQQGFEHLAPIVETIAMAEGLDAHAYSIQVRKKLKTKS